MHALVHALAWDEYDVSDAPWSGVDGSEQRDGASSLRAWRVQYVHHEGTLPAIEALSTGVTLHHQAHAAHAVPAETWQRSLTPDPLGRNEDE